MNYYIGVFKKYAVFTGRARRAEYWNFVLFNIIVAIALELIGFLLHSQLIYYLYVIAAIPPSIAVAVRRLHDTGRSGWLFLLVFIPIVGAIILIVWFATDSTPGSNQYGPNPKGVQAPPSGAPVANAV